MKDKWDADYAGRDVSEFTTGQGYPGITHYKSVFISTNLDKCLILWWDERHKELQAKHDIAILELQDQLEVANDHETTLSK